LELFQFLDILDLKRSLPNKSMGVIFIGELFALKFIVT
jgi:hypothetical protein